MKDYSSEFSWYSSPIVHIAHYEDYDYHDNDFWWGVVLGWWMGVAMVLIGALFLLMYAWR